MPEFADTFARYPGTPRRPFLPGARVWSVLGVLVAAGLATVITMTAVGAARRDESPQAAAPPSPSASPAVAGRLLVNEFTGRCLTAGKDGDRLTVQPCDTASVIQHWEQRDDGTFRSAGLCMDAARGSTDERTPLQVSACDDSPAQRWQVVSTGRLLGRHAGKCATVQDTGATPGTPVHLVSCARTAGFNWAWR